MNNEELLIKRIDNIKNTLAHALRDITLKERYLLVLKELEDLKRANDDVNKYERQYYSLKKCVLECKKTSDIKALQRRLKYDYYVRF